MKNHIAKIILGISIISILLSVFLLVVIIWEDIPFDFGHFEATSAVVAFIFGIITLALYRIIDLLENKK